MSRSSRIWLPPGRCHSHPWLVSSKSSGSEEKFIKSKACPKPSYTKTRWLPRSPSNKHTSTHGAQPPDFILSPLKENKRLVPKTKTENPGQMWGRFVVATHFYILKKKKSVCVEMTVCFPTSGPAPEVLWVQLTARLLKGLANPFSLLGQQQPPLPAVWPWA